MAAPHVTAALGGNDYILVPQKHTYLKRNLGTLFDSLSDTNIDGATGLMDIVGEKAYDVCRVFIPTLMSREEWEDDATAPTVPEIREAIEKGWRVNGLSGVGAVGKLLPMDLLKALLRRELTGWVASSATRSLPTSPSTSGEPESTSGTTTEPTSPSTPSEENSAGLSIDFPPSSEAATLDEPAISAT